MSHAYPLLSAPDHLPRPGNPERAETARADWREHAARADDPETARFAQELEADPAGRALLDAIFGNSPFLTQCILTRPDDLHALVTRGPEPVLRDSLERAAAAAESADQATAMGVLRRERRLTALGVALADMAGLWDLDAVTGALSTFADTAVQAALGYLVRQYGARGDLDLADGADHNGFTVLAMGKLGARELNYSSDIDLIVVYDPERVPYTGKRDVHQFAVKLTRELVRMLEERTAEGFVARADLRLRPDPSAMPVAVPIGTAETYYESLGQNWERAAMIKARPCAGDPRVGRELSQLLRPFVWRTHLDFWAIRDVHSIKRQISAQRGGSTVAVEGHDIKVGRGGIREIEFYAQTQQLIWGGRQRTLRQARTVDALDALARAGLIGRDDADTLIGAYRYLRRLEHRLQMVEDQQTQRLPETPEGIAEIAAFMGHAGAEPFRDELLTCLRTVEDRYAALFEEEPPLAGPGTLVFTGGEPDPETLETLARLGFRDGERVFNVVGGWHRGRYRATRSQRAREILTELVPTLLEALGRTANPDGALAKFDEFLSGLPAGVQLFSMLYANPRLLDLLARIMGAAPNLAEHLSHRPGMLEAVLTPGFFDELPGREELDADLSTRLADARDFQDALDIVRRWANDRKFQVGVHLLQGLVDVDTGGRALTAIAESALAALWPWVHAEFEQQHGTLPGPGMALLAMGKLGGREMTVASDLDLVFVAETTAARDDVSEGGKRPLEPGRYFARLAQRVINAVTAPTAEGRLYDVDMRLRPHGDSGELVSSLDGFVRYQHENAWTWEHMALTRARAVLGDAELCARLDAAIREVLTQPRDPAKLMAEVVTMRRRIEREFPAKSDWDVKYRRGGLVDLEFLAQALQLQHAHAHPGVLAVSTQGAFAAMADAGVLGRERAETLIEAARLMRHVQGMLRLMAGSAFDEANAPAGLMARLAESCGEGDSEALRARLANTAERVHAIFDELVEEPAASVLAADEEAMQ
ncbi:glutamate-ammonia-ligase adenylyltransferase [Limimonas halophila]|uniref:Bifunctional glutamine synthetase adenylyltransferase/adenylyl-removing enzyme n=1 Tax=Limimonas halophila TaxID=1082479 RepID=A0A1G7KX29_9PROT|nr:bifunctional [glutamine synthetase] adenylyltransferase/[glutamine synthetase]-adenylyl-L-tyrosine phosphorylase [Limimonas halophila]SDF41812.1 glutamate-ammonia-ligase adenylyltransferase [Limimonas halophila]